MLFLPITLFILLNQIWRENLMLIYPTIIFCAPSSLFYEPLKAASPSTSAVDSLTDDCFNLLFISVYLDRSRRGLILLERIIGYFKANIKILN